MVVRVSIKGSCFWPLMNSPGLVGMRSRTHLACKPEHAVALDSDAVVAAEIHEADQGDTTPLGETLKAAEDNLKQVSKTPPDMDDSVDLVVDKGYFSRDVLKQPLAQPDAEPKRQGLNVWNGDHAARRAVYNNRIQPRLAHARPNRLRHPTGLGRCLACRHLDRAEANREVPH